MGNYSCRETFSDKFSQSSRLPDTLATLEDADMMFCFFSQEFITNPIDSFCVTEEPKLCLMSVKSLQS